MREGERVLPTLRRQPLVVWALLLGTAVNKLADFFQLFLVLYILKQGGTGAFAAGVLACAGAGELVGLAAATGLTDRVSPRRLLVSAMLLTACGTALVPLVPGTLLLVVSFLVGAGGNAYRPAAAAVLGEVVAAADRVPVFAMQRMALNAGMMLAPLLGALIAARSLSLVFAVDALTSLVFAVIAWGALPGRVPYRVETACQALHPVRALRGDKRFLAFCAAMLANALVYSQYLSVLPLRVETLHLPVRAFAALVSLNAVVVLLAELPLTTLTRRLTARRVIVAGIALVGAGEVMYGLAGGIVGLTLATLVWTFGEAFSTPVQQAYAVSAAPSHLQGTYAGAATTAAGVGYAIGPAAGAFILSRAGGVAWSLAFALVTVAAAAAATAVPPQPIGSHESLVGTYTNSA